jgi:hypothetical protein
MNYKNHYELLIQKAKNRNKSSLGYTENHHIVPRSEGGLDEETNIVALTAREHFLAHWLLYRENPKINSRAFSFWRMCNGRGKVAPKNWITVSSRAYEEARFAHSKAISNSLKNKPKSKEHVAKVAEANRGKKRSEEKRANMRKPHKYSEKGLAARRLATVGKPASNIRKVKMIHKSTLETIREFSSIKLAAEFIGLSNSNICASIKNNGTCGGYKWSYV